MAIIICAVKTSIHLIVLCQLFVVSAALLQAELIQVFQAASNAATSLPSVTAPIDEILFVAANLIDSTTSQQQKQRQQQGIPLLLFSPPQRNKGLSLAVNLPELEEDCSAQYDYEAQPIVGTIALSKEEEELFQLIRDVRDKHCPGTTIRVAGGWVRDKLLHETASRDIDLVLSDISGSEFAQLFRDYLEENQIESEDVIYFKKSHGARSDHLQTASLTLMGFQIDFGRLRFEKYIKGSRIPEKTGVASVVEDAWRRDLTVNSLFYNVNINQVEDWTERGLQDLRLRTIATPMSPLPTLLEDPLRILRAIRFAAQLSFSMGPSLTRASQDVRVRYALQSKVSRDSIGNEVDTMFSTRNPTRAMKLLVETDLIDVAFPLYENTESLMEMHPTAAAAIYYSGFRLLSRTQSLVSRIFTQPQEWDTTKRRYLWYAAFFNELYDSTMPAAACTSKRGRRQGSGFFQLLADGLKRPKSDIQSIENIVKGVAALDSFFETQNDSAMLSILQSGDHFLDVIPNGKQRQRMTDLRWACYKVFKPIGPLWKEALILTLAASKADISESVKQYTDWVTAIEDRLHLGEILRDTKSVKPLLNGSQVQERALPGVHGGGFKLIMEAQEEWQIRHGFCHSDAVAASDGDKAESQLIDYLVDTFPEYAMIAQ